MRRTRTLLLIAGALGLGAGSVTAAPPEVIDLNRASIEELLAFAGIGRMYAHKVAAARPFTSRSELVTRQVVPMPVYLAIKHRLFVSGEAGASDRVGLGSVGAGLVDLNRASLEELAATAGIGRQYARRIVAARPFRSELELVGRRVMPLPAFRAVEGRIGVGH